MKTLRKLMLLSFPCLLASCTRDDGSFTGFSIFLWSLIGVVLIVLLSRFLARCHMEWKVDPSSPHRLIGKYWGAFERFGNWMENKGGILGKKHNIDRAVAISIVEAVLGLVCMLIPVFAHGLAGFYVASVVLFAMAIHIVEIYGLVDDNEKTMSNGKYLAYAISDILLIIGVIIVVILLIGMAFDDSSSSSSSRNTSVNDSNNSVAEEDTGSQGGQGRMDTYTVRYRYPSGSAIKDEMQNFQFDHKPTVAEVKAKIQSMGWGIDVSKVEVYSIAFGANNTWGS